MPDAETRRETIRAGPLLDTSPDVRGPVRLGKPRAVDASVTVSQSATLFRNEARHLEEWIEYHRLVGVEHFWLYDDASQDNWSDVLGALPRRRRGRGGRLAGSGTSALLRISGRLAARRPEEGLRPGPLGGSDRRGRVPPAATGGDGHACLDRHYADASAVYVNWRNFGTGGTYLAREGPILPRLTACAHPLAPTECRRQDDRPARACPPRQPLVPAPRRARAGYPLSGRRRTDDPAGQLRPGARRQGARPAHPPQPLRSARRSLLPLGEAARSGGPFGDEGLLWEHHEAFSRARGSTITSSSGSGTRPPTMRSGARPRRPGRSSARTSRHASTAASATTSSRSRRRPPWRWTTALRPSSRAEPLVASLPARLPSLRHRPRPRRLARVDEPSFAYSPIPFAAEHAARRLLPVGEVLRPPPAEAARALQAVTGRCGRAEQRLRRAPGPPEHGRRAASLLPGRGPSGSIYPQYGEKYLEQAAALFPRTAQFVVSTNNLDYARANLPPRMKRAVVLEGNPDHIDLPAQRLQRHRDHELDLRLVGRVAEPEPSKARDPPAALDQRATGRRCLPAGVDGDRRAGGLDGARRSSRRGHPRARSGV